MTLDPQQALSEFIDAWNAGERPDALDYLERVEPSQRDALSEDIAAWLVVAPTPAYDEPTRERIRAEPLYAAVTEALDSDAGAWPAVLPGLRARAGLSVQQLAAKVTEAFGLRGQEERTADYLQRMERGELEARGVSRRLLGTLARLLGARPEDLEAAGAMSLRPAAPVLFRRDPDMASAFVADDLDAVARAVSASGDDELDRLFTGGPDA